MFEVAAALAPHPAAEPRAETLLVADLGYDSLDLIELVAVIETALELPPLDEDELLGAKSIGDLLRMVSISLSVDPDGMRP